MPLYVLAYGALRSGCRLHHVIRGATREGLSGKTVRDCFRFDADTDLGASIVGEDDLRGGGALAGEVYRVSPGLLMRLDGIERPLRRNLEYVKIESDSGIDRVLLAWVYLHPS